MSRTRLPDRRPALTKRITFTSSASGREMNIILSMGYECTVDHIPLAVKEVFCDDIKVGSDNQAIVMDACILISRLLQYGENPEELAQTMCAGPSVIGAIVAAVAEEHRNVKGPDNGERRLEGESPTLPRTGGDKPLSTGVCIPVDS